MIQYNWQDIKEDYIKSELSLRRICEKHNIKMSALMSRIKKEGWREYKEITDEETENRTRRILNLSDRILDKVSLAIDEATSHILKSKEKTKEVEYNEELKKPEKEIINETEREEIISSLIDTSSLKQIVATLKDVKDIHMGFCADKAVADEENESGIIMISDVTNTQCGGDEAV